MNYEDALIRNIEHALEQAALAYDNNEPELAQFWRMRALNLDNEISRLECEALGAEMERNSKEMWG